MGDAVSKGGYLLLGVTGGIASGKTTVAKMFTELGVDVIDADQITREIVKHGTPLLEKIVEKFGAEILNADHSLNRKLLRDKIFQDKQARIWLEELLHPIG